MGIGQKRVKLFSFLPQEKSKLKNDIFQQQSVIDFSGCANWMDRYNFRNECRGGCSLQ